MTPRSLMILGASAGSVAILASFLPDFSSSVSLVIFACGVLFGKGYGIWEARQP